MSFFKPWRKKSEELHVREIRFLGEQDGPSEWILKEKLADSFRRYGGINRAYLTRVDFGEGTNAGVVLGLRTQSGPDRGIVENVGAIFSHVFNAEEHLDIVFLTDDQEVQLANVCPAFFEG